MTIPFGFSAGDIVLAIQVCTKILNALKEADGAASEYQDTTQFLQCLCLVLQHLQDLKVSTLNPTIRQAVQTLASAIERPLRTFVAEIQKYDPCLGGPSIEARKAVRAGLRRIKWSLFISERVDRLRDQIAAEVASIQLLLQSETLRIVGSSFQRLERLETRIEACKSEQHLLGTTIMGAVEALKPQLDRVAAIEGQNQRENQAQYSTSRAGVIWDGRTSHGFRDLSAIETTRPISTSGDVVEDLNILMFQFLATIHSLLTCLISIMTHIKTMVRTSLPLLYLAPTLLLNDNIRFEDFLGRKFSLPYEWFSKWPVFEGFLKHQFEGAPGEYLVASRFYTLYQRTRPADYGQRLRQNSFNISPGVELKIAALVCIHYPLEEYQDLIRLLLRHPPKHHWTESRFGFLIPDDSFQSLGSKATPIVKDFFLGFNDTVRNIRLSMKTDEWTPYLYVDPGLNTPGRCGQYTHLYAPRDRWLIDDYQLSIEEAILFQNIHILFYWEDE